MRAMFTTTSRPMPAVRPAVDANAVNASVTAGNAAAAVASVVSSAPTPADPAAAAAAATVAAAAALCAGCGKAPASASVTRFERLEVLLEPHPDQAHPLVA